MRKLLVIIAVIVLAACSGDDKKVYIMPECMPASPKTYLAKVTVTADSTLLIIDHYSPKFDETMHAMPHDIVLVAGDKILPLIEARGYHPPYKADRPFSVRVSLKFAALPKGADVVSLYSLNEITSWLDIGNIQLHNSYLNKGSIKCHIIGKVEHPMPARGFFLLQHNHNPKIDEHRYIPVFHNAFEYTFYLPNEERFRLASAYEYLCQGNWIINEFIACNGTIECCFAAPKKGVFSIDDYEFTAKGGSVNDEFNAIYKQADVESGCEYIRERGVNLLAQGVGENDSLMVALNNEYVLALDSKKEFLMQRLQMPSVATLLMFEKELLDDISTARFTGECDDVLFERYALLFNMYYAKKFPGHNVVKRLAKEFEEKRWNEYAPACTAQ